MTHLCLCCPGRLPSTLSRTTPKELCLDWSPWQAGIGWSWGWLLALDQIVGKDFMLKEISKSPQDPHLKGEKTGLSLPTSSQPVSLTVSTTIQTLTVLIQEVIFSSGTSFSTGYSKGPHGALRCAGSVPPWADTRCWGNIQGTSSTSANIEQPPKGEICSVPRLPPVCQICKMFEPSLPQHLFSTLSPHRWALYVHIE